MLEAQVAVIFNQMEPITPASNSNLVLPHGKNGEKKTVSKLAKVDKEMGHGLNVDAEKASCILKQPDGKLFNCRKCLEHSLSILESQISAQNRSNMKQFVDHLQRAGEQGLTAEEVWVSFRIFETMHLADG